MKRLLANISIKTSLTFTLVIFALLIMTIAALGHWAGTKGGNSLEAMDELSMHQMLPLARTQRSVGFAQLAYLNSVVASEDGQHQQAQTYLAEAETFQQSAQSYFSEFEASDPRGMNNELAEAVITAFYAVMQEGLIPMEAAVKSGDSAQLNAVRLAIIPLNQSFVTTSMAFNGYLAEYADQLVDRYDRDMQVFGYIDIAVIVAALFIIVLVRMAMVRSIVKPLDEAVVHFERIAENDLSSRVDLRGSNEIGKLFSAMQRMQSGLAATVATVRDSSGSIYIGAREIAGGNADLSSRTEQQAASLQETAASMEQLTQTVKQNADNARQASTLANDASGKAVEGGDVVEQVISTMHGISSSSQQVADIINVIDSIAFQTNILALNASVEAARAGEQGRGFAVVASEVRNLASRSAEAAKEIKRLIDASTAQVNEGSQLVEKAGATMREVVGSVRRVTDIMDEISAASQEQSAGIEQVNQAVAQMDEVTQQNAALVQEASAAASSLEEQAERLEGVVAAFRLEQGAESRQPALATPPPRGELLRPQLTSKPKSKAAASAEQEWEAF
ncbi:methyl-accepting chemotaxis protein [Halomonas sp. C22]|uniref:methyl-accepting chemotaxis protein n=1 Tax=Halomonas sp. C22 TaxID=2580567 RepID=UPI00119E2FBB|nr:methyl-accepting chemotaxis protein [Halomonas sp. C22]